MSKHAVIFLDIDGVLNSSAYFDRIGVGRDGLRLPAFSGDQIDPEAVGRLNEIVATTNARIVISSSWRLGHTLEELRELLAARGLVGNIIGVTPNLMTDARSEEIKKWIERHGATNYVILDDDHLAGVGMGPRFVWTSFVYGLTDEHVEQAIRILRRNRS